MENNKVIDLSILSGKKIYIATPMYGGMAHSGYLLSLINLFSATVHNGLNFYLEVIVNESLITRARNNLVDKFLKSEYDYLFFIDSDIEFNNFDIIYMLCLAEQTNKDIITASYPLKTINWESVHTANKNNLIKNQKDYEKYSGKHVVHFEKNETFDISDPVKVLEAGTGFMLIKKDVFIRFKSSYPEKEYIDDETNEVKTAFFDCVIDKETKRYLSEDYMFCKYVKDIGVDIWNIPWIELKHTGQFKFSGSFKDYLNMNYDIGYNE